MSSLPQFEHLRIPVAKIKSTTNNFDDKYIIGRGGFGSVYKGELLHSGESINIAIRRLDRRHGQGAKQFWMEISMLSSLKHKNLVSFVGFCDEDGEKIIINKHEVNESLDKHLSNPSLTWMQRLRICVSVARLLRYIHYETGYSYDVIHRNIKSSKVLLDENWEAKVGGFGLSIKTPATRRHRLVLEAACGTPGYADPKYVKTGSVTHKSDVYSFGVVLFEVLCGRNVFVGKNIGDRHLVPIVRQAYESGTLDDIIDPNMLKQMQPESLTIFTETAYHCIKVQRTQRPDMKRVVERLEKAMELQRKHENPVPKETPFAGRSSNYLKGKDMELLKIGFDAIKFATNDFAEKYVIGRGGFGTVYKAELEHFDSSAMKGELESELPKRRSIVAIKQIREYTKGEQGFITEVETLTMCKHPNIVSLLGFCYEHPHIFLVYEYVPNGSLEDYLEGKGKMTNLTWVERIQICIDVACGLNYLHTTLENKQKIIHRDIKSANILLDTNWVAKIADFGLSKFHDKASTLITDNIAGTPFYLDPEYQKKGKLKKEADIYSFGVVLFEILSGKLAYDPFFTRENELGLAPIARQHFAKGTIMKMVDPKLMEETDEKAFSLSTGPDKNSLQTFSKIAYQCLEETQAQRPKMEDVINELNKALEIQISRKDNLQISLADIKLATQEFDDSKVIGRGGFGKVYKGEVIHANGHKVIAAKRLDRKYGHGDTEFLRELEILLEYKHENVIGLVGYCNEGGEKIIAYEYASRGSLDTWLNNDSLTWVKRLQICIDVARGLEFLHGGEEVVIHKDPKSANILLTEDWEAKITDFGLSSISTINQDVDYVIDDVVGTPGYCDPLYLETGILSKEADIYSFGVVLFEILSGKLICEYSKGRLIQAHIPMYKCQYEEGKVDEIVFEDIKEQIMPQSLAIFAKTAYQCLQRDRTQRPTAPEVVVQLKKALEFQEDHEIWEPKLPKDYKEIIQMSMSPEIYSTKKKEDLYNIFSRGVLVQEDRVLLSFDGDGERNELISATTFSYINSCPYNWQCLPESRFHKVAEMLDISDLMIKINTKPQFLSPNAVYGVYLVFKFCDSRKYSSKQLMYVNLKHKMGSETLHSYFATWRDKEWMMIELCRFFNEKEDVVFEFLLESLSTHYFGDDAIYVEGIEFRAINNVEHDETNKSKEDQQEPRVNSRVDLVQQLPPKREVIFERSQNYNDVEKLYSVSQVNKKKQLMLSAKAALCNFSDMKNFSSKPSTESRFQEVIELLPQQVFRINCRIKSQMLSADTKYACYLVFKLLENCQGLHCPVQVRDLLHRENKETEIIYFVTPSPWNLHSVTRVPEQREDGWMEVNVWKFNTNNQIENDCIPLNLKLESYGGTMSGLIVCGLEFRPV